MSTTACHVCLGRVHLAVDFCPVCASPARPSNVRHAELQEEQEALEKRYMEAVDEAASRGAGAAVHAFEVALGGSEAVLAMWSKKLDADFLAGKKLYSTYYSQVASEVRTPGEPWDAERRIADEALFPGYKEKIRFAALTLDGTGLPSYGDCYFVLRDDLIAHRASVLEENGLVFAERHRYRVPAGSRAPWPERAKLAVAKLAAQLLGDTQESQFQGILLAPGSAKREDRFVEVHVWGPMSIGTFSRALITRRVGKPLLRRQLQERFERNNLQATIEL